MNETTATLLSTISAKQPRIKQQGYKEGRTDFEKAFWYEQHHSIDNYGNVVPRTDYAKAFGGNGWTPEFFRPQDDMYVTRCDYMFCYTRRLNIDLVEHLEECGVVLDTTNSTNFANMFEYSRITHVGILKCQNQNATNLYATFSNARDLEIIDGLVLKEDGSQTFTNTFNNCVALTDITIEGKIGKTISFASSPLSVDSMKSIITHLMDYSRTSYAQTYSLTFSSDCWDRLESDSSSPTGTTWKAYVQNLGWKI